MLLTTLTVAALLQAQTAQSILQTARDKQLQRWAAVDDYVIIVSVAGMEAPEYYQKMVVRATAGADSSGVAFRLVPMSEWANRTGYSGEQMQQMTRAMASGYRMLAGGFRSGQMSEGSGPLGAGSPMNTHVAGMLDSVAMFLDFSAAAWDSISDGRDEARADLRDARLFAARARLVGFDTTGARNAYLLRAEGLQDIAIEQDEDAPRFVLDVVSLWLDDTAYVPLRLKMDGHMVSPDGKTSTPVTIERLDRFHRQVGSLYEPLTVVMRITGLMDGMATDPKKKREMDKLKKDAARAKADMEKVKAQLAQLPPGQRRMVEQQILKMEKQMEMMANDGVVESELQRKVYSINKGPPIDWMPMQGR